MHSLFCLYFQKNSLGGATFKYKSSIHGADSNIFNFNANYPTHGISADF